MGPWFKIIQAASGVIGDRMGQRVVRDVQASTKHLNKEHAKTWIHQFESEHKKDIHDLVYKDSEVSAHWLNMMIDRSRQIGDVKAVQIYLHDSLRTANLTRSEKAQLFAKAKSKIESIRDHELMGKFMDFLREHGDDLF